MHWAASRCKHVLMCMQDIYEKSLHAQQTLVKNKINTDKWSITCFDCGFSCWSKLRHSPACFYLHCKQADNTVVLLSVRAGMVSVINLHNQQKKKTENFKAIKVICTEHALNWMNWIEQALHSAYFGTRNSSSCLLLLLPLIQVSCWCRPHHSHSPCG